MRWSLFEGVTDDEVAELLRSARRRRFRRGESVFHEGDPGDSLHLIDRGHLAVRVTTPDGSVATLRILGPGQHFGDLAILSTGRRSATITAVERAETLEIAHAELDRFRREHPAFEHSLLIGLAATVRHLSSSLLEAMYLPVPRRIARRLSELADSYGSDVIPITQDDLAGLSGSTRQTVNQVLVELRDRGALELGRGRITILDRATLDRAAR